jgi:hypothetical protein
MSSFACRCCLSPVTDLQPYYQEIVIQRQLTEFLWQSNYFFIFVSYAIFLLCNCVFYYVMQYFLYWTPQPLWGLANHGPANSFTRNFAFFRCDWYDDFENSILFHICLCTTNIITISVRDYFYICLCSTMEWIRFDSSVYIFYTLCHWTVHIFIYFCENISYIDAEGFIYSCKMSIFYQKSCEAADITGGKPIGVSQSVGQVRVCNV